LRILIRWGFIAKENNAVFIKNIEDIIEVIQLGAVIVLDLTLDMTDTESDSAYSSSDESDVQDNEEDLERFLILEDTKKLKVLARAFLHPEVPISVDCTATARCYFDRSSAAEQEDIKANLYRSSILDDLPHLRNWPHIKLIPKRRSPPKIPMFIEGVISTGRRPASRKMLMIWSIALQ